MTFPKRPSSHVIGDRAVQMFKNACEPAWVISDVSPDYGLDLRIELTEKDEVSGQEVHVQVKGRACAVKQSPTVEIRQATINYWLAKMAPLLIVLVDTTAGVIWYDWLENAYAGYPKQRNTDITVPLKLSKSTTNSPLSEELPRYAARFFGQLGATTNNLSQRSRLTEMLFHVVNLTHLFYGVWFYIGDITKNRDNTAVILEKLRCFYQEFGAHDIFLQVPWRRFASAGSPPIVLEAFASRFSAYEEIKKTFLDKGSGSGLRYLDYFVKMLPWHVSQGFTIQPRYTTSSYAETEGRKSFSARKTVSGSTFYCKRASSVMDTASMPSV